MKAGWLINLVWMAPTVLRVCAPFPVSFYKT